MSASFGAVQLASGSSLSGVPTAIAATVQSDAVDRSTKGDRITIADKATPSRTISLTITGLNDTSVLVRIAGNAAAKVTPQQVYPAANSTRRASTFACEPVVSVLTDIAKVLTPGRCVT